MISASSASGAAPASYHRTHATRSDGEVCLWPLREVQAAARLSAREERPLTRPAALRESERQDELEHGLVGFRKG